jgi:hypothetical protein
MLSNNDLYYYKRFNLNKIKKLFGGDWVDLNDLKR